MCRHFCYALFRDASIPAVGKFFHFSGFFPHPMWNWRNSAFRTLGVICVTFLNVHNIFLLVCWHIWRMLLAARLPGHLTAGFFDPHRGTRPPPGHCPCTLIGPRWSPDPWLIGSLFLIVRCWHVCLCVLQLSGVADWSSDIQTSVQFSLL